MKAPLSANHSPAIVSYGTDPLPAREILDDRMLAIDFGVATCCRNDNTTSLLKRAAITLAKARAENSTPSIAS